MSHYGPSRELVVDVCRTLLERGYLKATEGNVSVRVPGEDAYAITPSSYDYGKMEPGDICVLGLDGRHILGARKASIESSMHAAVYERRDDVSVIIHTHQPYASALALMERPIPALFDEQVRYLGRSVELVSYAPSGTSFLKKNVAKKLASGANAYILENHGVLVLGGDAEQAVHNMALLEKVALDYLLALLTDGRAEKVPLPIREIAFQKLRKDEKKLARPGRGGARRARRGGGARGASETGRGGGAGGRRRARARASGRRRPGGRGRRRVEPLRRPARRLRHQPLSGRPRRLPAAGRPRLPAHPPHPPRRHGRLPRLVRRELPPQQGADRRGDGAHPRRRAAQPRLQLPLPAGHREGRGGAPVGRRRQRVHRLPPGRRPDRARQQLRAGAPQGRRGRRAVRSRHRPLPRVRAQAGGDW